MSGMSKEGIRDTVREGYASVARREGASCCGSASPDALKVSEASLRAYSKSIGYSDEELAQIPEDANMGLSCGNPTAIASLQPGEVVLDLGSGAGMDAFLAAQKVSETGRVIGVDMTPEMLARARDCAARLEVSHYVEFREGMIEELPVVANSVDVIISNCVINLSPDKPAVFREALRVLKPGGRLAVSDICLSRPLPANILELAAAYIACIGGAMLAEDYLKTISDAGFIDIKWSRASGDSVIDAACHDPILAESIQSVDPEDLAGIKGTIWSYHIEARKPAEN
jgi:SAM-dependent methyltransferase